VKSISREMAFCLFNKVCDLAETADIEKLIELGVTPEQANNIAKLKPSHIIRMNECVELTIDQDLIVEAIQGNMDTWSKNTGYHINTSAFLLNKLGLMACEPHPPQDLQDLNLAPSLIQILADATAMDFKRAAKSGIKFYKLSANESRLELTLSILMEEIKEEAIINKLIIGDASLAMLSAIAGTRKRWFTEQRTRLNVPLSSGGPPAKLNDDDDILAYRVWSDNLDLPLPERFLKVYEALNNIALRDIWASMKTWEIDSSYHQKIV